MKFQLATGAAAMSVFDPACLGHRLSDDADWWTDPDEEIEEINKGNVILVRLREDGVYLLEIIEVLHEAQIFANLKVLSGRVFIGAGEEVVGGGLEPDCTFGGCFIDLDSGAYQVSFVRAEDSIKLSFKRTVDPRNSITESLRFESL